MRLVAVVLNYVPQPEANQAPEADEHCDVTYGFHGSSFLVQKRMPYLDIAVNDYPGCLLHSPHGMVHLLIESRNDPRMPPAQ